MEAVRRPSDNELCGYVEQRDGQWYALTVFGAVLGRHDHREGAVAQVLDEGLSSLAQRWMLRHGGSGDDEVVCIQEVNDVAVTVARGYYSLPGMPTLTITKEQLASGEWALHLERSLHPMGDAGGDQLQPEPAPRTMPNGPAGQRKQSTIS